MNVVQLLSQIELTGAETHAVSLAEALEKKGYRIFILSDQLHLKTSIPFVPLAVHRTTFIKRLQSIFKLRQFIRNNRIEIIHAHSRASAKIGYWATRGLDCALVTTLHGRQHYSLSKKLFNHYGEKMISVCENIKKQMILDFNLRETQIQVIRNFYRFKEISPDSSNSPVSPESPDSSVKPAAKLTAKPTNNSTAPRVISFLGRTTGPKGQNWEFILQNFCEMLLKKYPLIEIHFAGGLETSLNLKTQDFINSFKKNYPNRFQFHGPLDNLQGLIQKSHLVIGAGRIAIEALLAGKKVLSLGEQSYEGLVTASSLEKNKASNFGDILETNSIDINWTQFYQDLELEIENDEPQILTQLCDSYEETQVVNQIIATYHSASFKKRYSHPIPILMYHQVVEKEISSPHKIFITAAQFEKHLLFLKKSQFTSLTFGDLYRFKTGILPWSEFPKKPIILTFDDGYENNLTLALPLLKKYNFKSVIYLLANPHTTNYWDKNSGAPSLPLMSREQRQMISEFMEVGSHGFDHKKLSEMTDKEAYHEICDSKIQLEKEFKKTIYSYAYTYGVRHPMASEFCKKAGYEYAVNTTTGGFHHEEDPYSLFRVSIFPTDTASSLKRKTKSWYRRYYYFKRKE